MAIQIQLRRGTASQWTAANPTLSAGEIGTETDTGKFKIGNATTAWNSLPYAQQVGAQYGLFHKLDFTSVAFTKTGAGTASVKAGTRVDIDGTLVSFSVATAITMPTLTAGTEYFIYATTAGAAQAVAATGTWPTPVASPPANSRLIGGFHYAPGGNASARSGGNTTANINEFSMWDLKFRPAADDPRGMTLVSNTFWSDIYFCNRDPQTLGTSRNAQLIADGETGGTTTAIIPTAFGGNGSTRYSNWNWWNSAETLAAFGKRHPTYQQFAALAFGATEAVSRGNDPVTTGIATTNAGSSQSDQVFTSKWGVIQSTGVMYAWGADFGGGAAAASWTANTDGRGSTYQMENAARFGGAWNVSASSGSRSSSWIISPTNSDDYIGARGVCDHLRLV